MISVLYVDDDPLLLDLGKMFLEMIGNFSVETCTSAPEALERLEQTAYSAILSDYEMPVMNGIQFLKEVRERYPSLPFIIFTGRGREDVVIEALNNGADFYLHKGGEPKPQFAELSHMLHIAVERKQSELQIHHLARLYTILSKTHEATVYIRDKNELLQEACRIAVQEGGFLMVWVGLLHPQSGLFRPVAHCSSAGDSICPPAEPGDGLPIDAPPTRIAFGEGRYYVTTDNRNDPNTGSWKDQLLAFGFSSSAAFPLRSGDRVIGAMTFHAPEPLFFNEEEVALLLELTDNLSFALELMDREHDITELKKMGDSLQLANKKLNLLNSVIRHDILNTVTGLLGLEDMVLDVTHDDKVSGMVREIRESTKKVQQQIEFTREYQDVGVNFPRWQNVRDCVTKAIKSCSHEGIEITVNLESMEIFADPLLEKVFYNLIDNAIRHGGKIASITFSFSWLMSDSGILIICEDNGTGIAEAEKELIFEQGFGKNTGQGLFLIREILGITGISIKETGTSGHGARFEMVVKRGMFRFTGQK